jgi:coenzyme F420 hydrogenase subunit beta
MLDGLPKLIKECNGCGLCYESCPGIEFKYPEFNKRIFGTPEADNEIGYYHSICVGQAANEAVHRKGASGGVVTALLLGLLKRGEISGAVVVGMDREHPWIPKVRIATSENAVFEAAKSKYSMVPVNEILGNLDAFKGDLAFVGLPCHIHGMRKLERMGWKNAKKIKYCIGTFCGFNMDRRATDFLIRKARINKEDIESLEYRGGDWPGGFSIKTKDSRRFFVEKHVYNYLNLMFVPRRCLVCPDLTNEFADLSVGDAWNKDLSPGGWSTIAVRTPKGKGLFDCAVKAGDIKVKGSDKSGLKEGHSHLILYKKKGVSIRARLMGLDPDFGIHPPGTDFNERAFNVLFFYLISFMRTRLAIFLFGLLPVRLPGTVGKHVRSIISTVSRSGKNKDSVR